ncbi:MAG: hypothetical protein R3E96_02885 [Planctomycetota bacterium]
MRRAPGATDFGHTCTTRSGPVDGPVSLLGAGGLGGVDLRRYNVLVVPSGDTGEILQGNWQRLAAWVRGGGTLTAIGDSAAGPWRNSIRPWAMCAPAARRSKSSTIVAARRARAAGRTPIDEALVWAMRSRRRKPPKRRKARPAMGGEDAEPAPGSLAALDEDLAAADRLARRFARWCDPAQRMRRAPQG